jgi:AraC-like DNA-binding protein
MSEFIFIGIAQAIFTIIFIMSKENRPLSDNILVAWIIILAMPLMTRALSPAMLDISIHLLDKKLAYPLCLGPFLWLYVKSVTGDIQKLKWSYLLHFLPFILATFFQIFFQKPPLSQLETVDRTFGKLIWLINIASLFCYSSVVLWRLQKHSKEVLNRFSSLTTQITLRWLTWLTLGFMIAYMLPLFARFASLPIRLQSHGYAFTGFIFILSFFGLKQTQIFAVPQKKKIINEAEKSEQEIQPKKEKYERSGLTQERALQFLERLEAYTQKEKPYLDANLTVDKLAAQAHISRHYLTQILSEQLNKNFYLYINEYRINQVKQLLQTPEHKNMTLLDIAYECGFNSKSTFNAIFKKITNMTPTQYKKEQLNDQKL